MQTLKTTKSIHLWILMAFFLSFAGKMYAQIPAGAVLITGTDFTPVNIDATKTFYGASEISYYGLQPSQITTFPPLLTSSLADDFFKTHQYGVTDKPSNLNTNYFTKIAGNYQFIFSPFTGTSNVRDVIKYNASGLVPGSVVTFKVDYCSPTDLTLPACVTNNVGVGTDMGFKVQYEAGTNSPGDKDVPKVKMGACGSYIGAGVADANGNFWMSVLAPYDTKPWHSVAISKIEIYGSPKADIMAAQGSSVCKGEMITLQSKYTYDADYTWKDGSGTTIGTGTSVLYEVKALGPIKFSLDLKMRDGSGKIITSPSLTVTGIECCSAGASRQTVFFDDFGRFDLANDPTGHSYFLWDYSNILDPVEVTYSSTERYRYELTNPPLLHKYAASGPPSDGWYTVAGYLSKQMPGDPSTAHMSYANNIGGVSTSQINFDHSGTLEGAALFINLEPNSNDKLIYKREIGNLCGGKDLFFEAWISVCTDGANEPSVGVTLYDKANPAITTSFTAQAKKGQSWIPLTATLPLVGNTLVMELTNKSGTAGYSSGNDLVIDDIKLMTCSAPAIEAYFDLVTLTKSSDFCNTPLNLYANYASTFKSFYGNTPYFVYQWSTTPRVLSSWKNIGTPSTKETYSFTDVLEYPDIKSLKLKDGDRVYFRVVAATSAIMSAKNNFQGVGYEANTNDPCKNYSVSRHIIATVKCPACEKADINGLKVTAPADTMLCSTGTRTATEISVDTKTALQPLIGYAYYDPTNTIIGSATNAATGFAKLPVDYSKPGVYSLKVWDPLKPTEVNCQATYQIKIEASPAPSYTMGTNQTICDKATLTDISAAFTAVGDVSFSLNIASAKDGSPASATSNVVSQPGHTYTYTPVEANAPGTYSYTISDLKDKYCPAINYLDPVVIKVNPNPVVAFTDPADICTDGAAIDLTPKVTIDGVVATATTGVVFSGAAGVNITAAGLFTPIAVTTVTSQTLTAKYEDATTTCKGVNNATIKIQPKPVLSINLNKRYCSEETIDLMAAVTPKNGTFTVLPTGVTISATNTVDASKMISGDIYTFTYNYTDATTKCSNTINGTTYSITVPPVGTVVPFSIAGVKTPTATGDLTANYSVPTDPTLIMNWIDPTGTKLTDHTTTISANHGPGTYTYQAYQTMDGCVGEAKDVTFSVSACAAEAPLAKEAYFCSAATTKSISVSGQRTGDVVGWLAAAAGEDGFKAAGLTPATTLNAGESFTLNSTAAGVTEYYVAAYDATNTCWSSAAKVTFKVVAEPTASIKSQDKIACYNYNNPKPIEVKPVGIGVTGTFKLDNVVTPIPEYVPAAYSTGATLNLSYQVDSLITPAGYTGTAVSCTSQVATRVYTVEFVKAPTIAPEKKPIDTKAYELTMTGDKATNELRWYLDPALASVKTGAKYDPIQGADYSLSNVDVPLTVYGKEVNPVTNCESAVATGTLTLVKCPHTAPGVVYEKPSDKLAWDDCEATVTLATPAVKIDNATLAKRSTTTKYVWYDSTKTEVFRGNVGEFVPTNISVGKHKMSVSIYDIITVTNTYCETPATDVNYEVFRMPTPSLTIPKESLCVYDKEISIKGFDDSKEVTTGTFYMTPGSTSTTVPMVFNPASLGAGDYSISFEYTTGDGCTAKSAAKSVKVTEVAKPDDIQPMTLDTKLAKSAGVQVYKFTATPAGTYGLQWYNSVPQQGISTAVATTNDYTYTLAPQFINNPGVADEKEYFVYFVQKDPISGCESKNATAKLTVTDCPTPAPTVVNDKACTYFTGTEIPSLTGTPSNNWPSGFAVDATAYVYTTDKLTPNATYKPATLDATPRDYTVEFRTYSPLHGCESPATTATLSTFKQNAPKPISAQALSECFGLGTSMSFEVENPTGTTVNWYEGVSNTSAKVGSAKKLDFNSSDGDRTAYASLKMTSAPFCESTPGDVKFTFDELDSVKTPIVEGTTACATSEDINPATGRPGFRGSKVYPIQATDYSGNVVWYSDAAATQKIAEAPAWDVLENNTYKQLDLGVPAEFYAKSYVTVSNKKCWSSISKPAIVLAKPTPKKPAKIVDGAVSTEPVTFICQGSNQTPPVYRAKKSYGGDISWYTEDSYKKDSTISNADTLNLKPYLEESGLLKFIATETFEQCQSDTTTFVFGVAKRPQPMFEADTLYFCANNIGSKPLAIKDTSAKKDDTFKYEWFYSDADGDKKELETTADENIKTWYYTTPGIDEATVIVTNKVTGCKETATIRLVVAEYITPRFSYDVYSGPQEIVFRNQATSPTISGSVWDPQTIESETYSTRYNWTFVYNADQSVRKMVQKDSTRTDRADSLYYVGRGPSDYDYVIEVATDNTDPVTGVRTVTYRTKIGDKEKPVSVTNFNGKTVQVHGGIPFEYGASTVTLTRSVFTMDGIPYDTRSCNATSPEVEVFMPITTGLFIPTSFAPGHSSPMVSVFKPFGDKVAKFNIWVYDNWGNTVFYSNKIDENGQPTEAWDGRDQNGNLMPADVYYWKVDATFEDGTKWEGNPTENGKKKPMGSVFLLR